MMPKYLLTAFLLTAIIAFATSGCEEQTETEQSTELSDKTGINIEGAWARPAGEGRMSAAYFLISNFEDKADTLVAVESDIARNVEIHESYEREEDMVGMREVPNVEIPAQSTVRFEQGGLHVMLIQLTRQLQDGDTFELTLTFSNHGSETVEISARL